ncbi:uncharacterized protein LOC119766290 [Culex quinquefasciatus]|uniref:uncharacterized protein LOC119766290 n=1 Tax=Culex quinquefasciatus TaxID=7176 RepID=UPI0018E3211B|nr:uncharacterized protein LOC119766290 [Culex quinquefasciatus]
MAEPTLSKEPEATMTNLNALFPQTALMKLQQSMVEGKEKAPPAGPSSGKQIAAAKETDDLWSQAVADQLQQPQQENKQDGDGWCVVPPKKEKNKKNPKKVSSSSAGSSGASGSVDPKFLRPRTPRPTAISDAQRNRDRSRSAPKNGDSKKPKIIVTAETNEEAKQPSSGEMDVDGVDEMKRLFFLLFSWRGLRIEVEESSDGDEFRSVNGTGKRRKTSNGAVVGDGPEENFLNNNKFSPLAGNNNYNNNNGIPAGKGSVPPVPVVPVAKKPPPLVVKNTSYAKLRTVMSPCTTKPSSSEERFETARAHLIVNKVEFYTHEKRSERQLRVVVRGLPSASPELVKKNLKESQNLDAVEVHAIKRKGEFASSEETPYIVTFPKGYTSLK